MRIRFLILALGMVLSARAEDFAVSTGGVDAATEMVYGRAALEDGLYDVALAKLERALLLATNREDRARGIVGIVEALIGLGRLDDALRRVDEGQALSAGLPEEADFQYWRAMALFRKGEAQEALKELARIDARIGGDASAIARLRLTGKCRAAVKDYDGAAKAFAEVEATHPKSPEIRDNLLDWAGVLVQAGKADDAENILRRLIREQDADEAADRARLWLGALLSDQGRNKESEQVLGDLAAQESANAALRAEASYSLGRLLEARKSSAKASDAYEQASALTRDPSLKLRADVSRGLLWIRNKREAEGIRVVREAIGAAPTAPETAGYQLEFAQALLDRNLYEPALESFQHYLEAFSDKDGQARALMGKGWSLWELSRYLEAAMAFEKTAGLLGRTPAGERALFKAADSYFKAGQYRLAGERYLDVAGGFTNGLTSEARFQAGECLARQGRHAEAGALFESMILQSTDSVFRTQARLRMARLMEAQEQWESAAAWYEKALGASPTGQASTAEALLGRGLSEYRLGRFDDALSDFSRVVNEYPDDERAEQAFYMRGWSLYLLGRPKDAMGLARSFVEKYPDSQWAPEVLFWMGEHLFNQGLTAEAEKKFSELASSYPKAVLADQALYWAGRSALTGRNFLKAIDYFNRLALEYPESPRLAETRFAQGDALSELGQFAPAILAFEEVIIKYPDCYLVDMAWGRKGDCLFTLATDEPRRYEEAANCYRMVLDRPTGGRELKWQAEYKIGRCKEKMGRVDEAMESYLNVVYGYLNDRGSGAGAVWFTRAAFNAAALQEATGRWREAARIYRRVADAGVPASDEALQRVRAIRMEHWVLF